MITSITNFLIIFFIFQQLKSQIDQNGFNPFCDETLHILNGAVAYWFVLSPRNQRVDGLIPAQCVYMGQYSESVYFRVPIVQCDIIKLILDI